MRFGRYLLVPIVTFVALMLCGVSGAQADAARLGRLLQIETLFEILRDEGLAYGEELREELFPDTGAASWQSEIAAIHAPERARPMFESAFETALEGKDTTEMEAFLDSDLGRRLIGLEISVRRAMLDPAVEEAATLAAEEAAAVGDARLLAVLQFIETSDLIEPNVTGGLNANLAFYRGMVEGGAFPYAVSEADMLADVWAQEPEVRSELTSWMTAYLYLAYQPLSDEDLAAYTEFSASKAGQVLNRALFSGFDAVFGDVSARLGAAAAGRMRGQDL